MWFQCKPASLRARVLVLIAAVLSLPWASAEMWWGGNFTAPHPGGRGLNFGGGTNGDVNAIACMEHPKWQYCLVGGNFTQVGSARMQNVLKTGPLAMYDKKNLRWSPLGSHKWTTTAQVYAIQTTTVYDRVTFRKRTVSFIGGSFIERVSPIVNVTGSGTVVYNFMIHNGYEWEKDSFNLGFDKAVHGMALHRTIKNCDETLQACADDIYVVGKFGSTADYAVPCRRVAVGRYSDREHVSGGISQFIIKYTWSYISSNNVPSYANSIIHCGGLLFVGGAFEGGMKYTMEFNATFKWKTVSTGLDGEVTSLACAPTTVKDNKGKVLEQYGILHVGGTFTHDDGMISTPQRYHVTTASNTQLDWHQVGRTPSKTTFSCEKCTGTPLPLGFPVTAVVLQRNAAGPHYIANVAAHNRIYQYPMGAHPHEISPTNTITQTQEGKGDGVIRTIFISMATRAAPIVGTTFAAVLLCSAAQ